MLGKRVYIAGPYSGGDTAVNVGVAMDYFSALRDLGYAPYVPHLSHFLHIHQARGYEDWMDLDMDWLKVSDWVFRLPGESSGADHEVAWAEANGVPVVEDLLSIPDHALTYL